MKILSYLLFACMLLLACKGNNKKEMSKEEIDALFAQEMLNQNRALQGGEKVEIKVITDPAEVSKLKARILAKLGKNKKLEEKTKAPSLAERYKKGDKSTVPGMLRILSGKNSDARLQIYSTLGYDEGTMVTEPELIQAIYAHLNDPEDQAIVIQVAGYNNFPGYVVKFETMLVSGKIRDNDRLLYWLSHEGSSVKGFDHVKKLASGNHLNDEEMNHLMTYLEGYAKSSNKTHSRAAVDLAFSIYDRKLIPAEKFEELRTSYSSSNPSYNLLHIIFEHGDKRAVPIAHDMLRKGIASGAAMEALIRLEGAKHKALLLEHMADDKEFFEHLSNVVLLYQQTKDESLIEEMLGRYERFKNYDATCSELIVEALTDMQAVEYLQHPEKGLTDPKLILLMKAGYVVSTGTVRTFAADLYSMGVIDKKLDDSILVKAENAEKFEFDRTSVYLYNLLNCTDIFINFDAETGMVPVDYDEMIRHLAAKSGGKLKDVLVWMDADMPETQSIDNQEDASEIHYKITVVANGKAYTAEPKDIGDWYDVQFLVDMMNRIAADAGLKERYNFLYTGDQTAQLLFGPEQAVLEVVKKYRLGEV